jgi:antibiotic biosynthesis monooxygenase (ABM) superfamily enzyme
MTEPQNAIAETPAPPYYAVVFTSVRTDVDEGYAEMAAAMAELAARQPGYLGIESAREGLGITVSYWRDLDAIAAWKRSWIMLRRNGLAANAGMPLIGCGSPAWSASMAPPRRRAARSR